MDKRDNDIFLKGPISFNEIVKITEEHTVTTDVGAHSLFLGRVRADIRDEGTVTAIEFTAYKEMAQDKVNEITNKILGKYHIPSLKFIHSTGIVGVGEICLLVFTAGKHRRETIDACNETVELIKAELPVWGRELLDTDQHVWKKNI